MCIFLRVSDFIEWQVLYIAADSVFLVFYSTVKKLLASAKLFLTIPELYKYLFKRIDKQSPIQQIMLQDYSE